MNIVIIEDELNAAEDLEIRLKEIDPVISILAKLDSVKTSAQWLRTHASPDLIFMDIHLGDGTAFEIFDLVEVNSPVIFCTAYDSYLLQAFKNNGIGYIVKPATNEQLAESIERFAHLKTHFNRSQLLHSIAAELPKYKTSYLVHFKAKMLPVTVEQIILFCVKNDLSCLVTEKGEYIISKTLDALEKENDPRQFYRVNRQYMIAYRYIHEIEYIENRKLEIKMRGYLDIIVVSKEKAKAFKDWLDNR